MKAIGYIVLVLGVFGCTAAEISYDERTNQQPIETTSQIDSVLNTLEEISYSDLSEAYLEETGNTGTFTKMIKKGTFYQVKDEDVYKYIVGTVRIKNFIAHDDYYRSNVGNASESYEQIWLIDNKLLHKVLELKQELSKGGYDPDGFYVRTGHRHPVLNEEIAGASRSQHIAGKATDITIKDINQDGISDQADKEIVLEILNKIVIKNEGGIGRYPGTMSVHFDVRGSRARWDSY
ncbi:MAG: DUF882 domain-containing protein [Flavobacteriales bacterium]|nr:DUF882 domain-containing protein [Flavobacteriales bacterium]